eukprot:jgi/Galph1/2762/GphlegSOOS_G1409.1
MTQTPTQESLKVRLVYIDYYLERVFSDGSYFQQPVIRIFGSTPAGQKCAVHVHNVLPYFYVHFPEEYFKTIDKMQSVVASLVSYLENFLASNSAIGRSNSTSNWIHTEIVQKIPFYGYHHQPSFFLKIQTNLPWSVRKLADACLQFLPEAPWRLQPFESHLSYISQFMIDYNLYGMNFVQIQRAKFRIPLPLTAEIQWKNQLLNYQHLFESYDMSQNSIWSISVDSRVFLAQHVRELCERQYISSFERTCKCDIEIDVDAKDIMNSIEWKDIPLLKDASDNDRLVPSLRGLWEEDMTRREILGMAPYVDCERPQPQGQKEWIVDLNYSEAPLRNELVRQLEKERTKMLEKRTRLLNDPMSCSCCNGMERDQDVICTENETREYDIKQPKSASASSSGACKSFYDTEQDENDDSIAHDLWNDILTSTQSVQHDLSQATAVLTHQTENERQSDNSHASSSVELSNISSLTSHINVDVTCTNKRPRIESVCSVPSEKVSLGEQTTNLAQHSQQYNGSMCQQEETDHSSSSVFGCHPIDRLIETNSSKEEKHSILWMTPVELPPCKEQVVSNAIRKSRGKYISKTYLDSYGRMNTRLVIDQDSMMAQTMQTNSHKEEDAADILLGQSMDKTKRKECDLKNCNHLHLSASELSSEEEYDEMASFLTYSVKSNTYQHNSSQSDDEAPVARPSSPKYDEMDSLAAFHNQESHTKYYQDRRKSLQSEDSHFFSPGYLLDNHQSRSTEQNEFEENSREDWFSNISQGLTCMSIEVITDARTGRYPNPSQDAVLAVCMVIQDDRVKQWQKDAYQNVLHMIIWNNDKDSMRRQLPDSVSIQMVSSEEELFYKTAQTVETYDVDMIFGYDIQRLSIGYMIERAEHLGYPWKKLISRSFEVIETTQDEHIEEQLPEEDVSKTYTRAMESIRAEEYAKRIGCNIRIVGRYVFSIWNILRLEVKLPYYDYEGICAEMLKKRVAAYEPWVLGRFFQDRFQRCRACCSCLQKAIDNLEILEEIDWVPRTCELARIFGIDFRSVVTRGSQFRVESMMARLAHANGYLLLSASRNQLVSQPAMECLPLVLEPYTGFYQDPVLVMDFQSLYPSIIIAHNLCYCTMLGNIRRNTEWSDKRVLGVIQDYQPPLPINETQSSSQVDKSDYNSYYVAPSGECFVTPGIRKGILPRLLQEILSTRLMLKSSMKWVGEHYQGVHKDRLLRVLNAQQFALKLIANVTYGYTSASFSGRMPCAGLADAIVQHGRQAMEKSTEEIQTKWKQFHIRVVYGDTDSLFAQIPDISWQVAWQLGEQITEQISQKFPFPMRLVLEKVYQPCLLVTKKRYVGYAYESKNQMIPSFDAKGIETIRRDTCAAVQKLIERCLRLLFETANLSVVSQYLVRQWTRMHRGRFHWMDFIFYMQVRWGTYSGQDGHEDSTGPSSLLPPAAVVAWRRAQYDARSIPLYGERVPFIVAYWMEKPRTLQDCVCSPQEFLALQNHGHAVLHVTYYITKQMIPALQRFFSCLGVDVSQWYQQMKRPSSMLSWLMTPKKATRREEDIHKIFASAVDKNNQLPLLSNYHVGGLYYYYRYYVCVLCGKSLYDPKEWPLCPNCKLQPSWSSFVLYQRWIRSQQLEKKMKAICRYCTGQTNPLAFECQNFHCPILYERNRGCSLAEAYEDIIHSLEF